MSTPQPREAIASARANYEAWLRTAHGGAHQRRSAARNAAFFLPHLQPGMAVLDAGCGPGSITIGLAEAVAPGHVTGVDISAEALAAARNLAAERGCGNVTFDQHHLRALPYADASFDAVLAHAVFQHLDEPERALGELRRVLRSGGVIAVADADYDGALYWPDDPLLGRSMDLLASLRGGEGDARVGKKLRALLAAAGFETVRATVTATADGDTEGVENSGRWQSWYLAQEPLVAYVEALGLATRDDLVAMSAAWLRWSRDSGAFWARFWCEAAAFKRE